MGGGRPVREWETELEPRKTGQKFAILQNIFQEKHAVAFTTEGLGTWEPGVENMVREMGKRSSSSPTRISSTLTSPHKDHQNKTESKLFIGLF